MFRKRQKKIFAPGTFIPTSARLCAIIQLCLAFSILLWNAALPFTGELFTIKSKLVLYQDVMGTTAKDQLSIEKRLRLARNQERFEQLPPKQAKTIIRGLESTQKQLQRSFFNKIKQAIHILFFEIPFYEQVWLLLSFILPILLLKRTEGVVQVIWVLPLLAALYAVDNRMHGQPPLRAPDTHLFPTEHILIKDHLKEPLSENIFEQQIQLQKAWKLYLIKEWNKSLPSPELEIADQQAENGEFAFNLARLNLIAKEEIRTKPTIGIQEPLPLLALYFFWNVFFACVVWRNRPQIEKQI